MKIRMDVKATHPSQILPAGEPDWQLHANVSHLRGSGMQPWVSWGTYRLDSPPMQRRLHACTGEAVGRSIEVSTLNKRRRANEKWPYKSIYDGRQFCCGVTNVTEGRHAFCAVAPSFSNNCPPPVSVYENYNALTSPRCYSHVGELLVEKEYQGTSIKKGEGTQVISRKEREGFPQKEWIRPSFYTGNTVKGLQGYLSDSERLCFRGSLSIPERSVHCEGISGHLFDSFTMPTAGCPCGQDEPYCEIPDQPRSRWERHRAEMAKGSV
jgi:hypothetical protein